MPSRLSPQDALLVVDVQNDFCPGGALPVPDGDRVVPVLNRWIGRAQTDGAIIVASRDQHPQNHISFEQRGGPWPPHCIRGTQGAAFEPDLRLPDDAWIIDKGENPDREQYSAFHDTGLANRLTNAGVKRIWVGGLAEDVCVEATVRDGLEAGFEVHLITAATRAAEPDKADQIERDLADAGAILETEPGDDA